MFDSILTPALARKDKKRDRIDEEIIKNILEQEDNEVEAGKPLELYSESLKGYMKELKEMQSAKESAKSWIIRKNFIIPFII